mmetsp:Transcript_28181/g.61220  ORF Transcript_28181/g.61220 Transcript_28181/m.61220 type:complete len:162 (-) Transcript_28181:3536-4021(-)
MAAATTDSDPLELDATTSLSVAATSPLPLRSFRPALIRTSLCCRAGPCGADPEFPLPTEAIVDKEALLPPRPLPPTPRRFEPGKGASKLSLLVLGETMVVVRRELRCTDFLPEGPRPPCGDAAAPPFGGETERGLLILGSSSPLRSLSSAESVRRRSVCSS